MKQIIIKSEAIGKTIENIEFVGELCVISFTDNTVYATQIKIDLEGGDPIGIEEYKLNKFDIDIQRDLGYISRDEWISIKKEEALKTAKLTIEHYKRFYPELF